MPVYDCNMITFLIFSIIILQATGKNVSQTTSSISEHPIHKGWICCSIMAGVGVILNSLVILIFIKERSNLVTSVNAMIV